MSFLAATLKGVPVFVQDKDARSDRRKNGRTTPCGALDDPARRARSDNRDKVLLNEWLTLAAESEMESPVTHQLDMLLGRLGRI